VTSLARFALDGITAVVLGAFAEAHYSVQTNLRNLASLDPLTPVFNVASFYKEIGVLETWTNDFAVMLVDVDDLKRINDTHGDEVGTAAIQGLPRFFAEWAVGPIVWRDTAATSSSSSCARQT
jgi:GGDEF domain-containing protein